MTKSADSTAAPQYNRPVKKEMVYDLTRGGSGTPWENRGEHGAVGGFLKTAFASMFKPGPMLDQIRGTTVNDDSRRFLTICIVFWALSVPIHAAILHGMIDTTTLEVNDYQYWVNTGLITVVAAGWAWLMFRLLTGFYHKLVTTEIKQPVPQTLTYNIVAYTLGGSVLAILPFIGPPLGAFLMFLSLTVAGRKRLYLNWRASVIDALLPHVSVAAMTLVLYFAGGFLLSFMLPATSPVVQQPLPMSGR